jgi:ABC-type transport system substrate-binding protein
LTPAAAAPTHADAIRFGLVGQPTGVNAWARFDEAGAIYANYALHADEYPRLYRLSTPAREFKPFIADGLPSAIAQDGDLLSAAVKLQANLRWSDGSPLTAQDVAFTANTALAFRLGLDWRSAYTPERLDHAEAVDALTVKFYFKGPINVGDWQYGLLQGPILSQAFWSPKLTEASALLPSADLLKSLDDAQARATELQGFIDADNAQLLKSVPNSTEANELKARIQRHQNDLNAANSEAAKLQDEVDAALGAARAALYALPDMEEPTFGPFLRAEKSGETFTRSVNSLYPLERPNYDRAVYTVFDNLDAASKAFQSGEVDVVLGPRGAAQVPSAPSYPTSSARFLVFNPDKEVLTDPAFRSALACILDVNALLSGQEWAYAAFVLPGPWLKEGTSLPCSGLPRAERITKAVEILKQAGYSWGREPTTDQAGSDLRTPDGQPFPPVTLLTTTPGVDLSRSNIAAGIEVQARALGIPLSRQEVSSETLRYSVYSSRDYDMAILGWTLSEYPGYLCDWFQAPSPFADSGDRLKSACEALNSTADLGTAYQAADEIQTSLFESLPFIPLYLRVGYENYQHVTYPFEATLNGLSGLYGAPSLAIPAP